VHHHRFSATTSFLSFFAPTMFAAVGSLGATGCHVASDAPVMRTVTLAFEAPHLAPIAPSASTSTESHALVWTQDGDGHRSTWTVDETGRVLQRVDGVRVAAGGSTWAWTETVGPVATQACPTYDDAGNEVPGTVQPPAGRGVRVALEPVDVEGAASQTLLEPAKDSGAQELEQSVELMATVGHYLFVRTAVYVYACGAHGGVSDDFLVWDATRRAVVWSSSDDVTAPSQQDWTAEAPRDEAVAALAADEEVKMFADENGHVDSSLTEIVPFFGPDARLDVRYQLTAFACYACSDGSWSSYSRSTRFDARRTPAPLRTWVVPAAGVHAFALAHPELTLGGWSAL
jgi:hypothetical protein